MFGKMFRVLLMVGCPLMVEAGAASAAPVTLSYDFTGGNATADSLLFSQGGVDLTVTGHLYTAPETINSAVQVDRGQNGLGVCGSLPVGQEGRCRSPLLDGGAGANDNEVLKFSFSSAVSLLSISFFNNDTNDVFDFFIGAPLDFQFDFLTPSQGQRVYSFASPNPVGSLFGIGIRGNTDQVRIAGLSVQYDTAVVPLPPAGFLLLGAVVAMAALRRRKTILGQIAA
ncbi:VPLPA-CTERM sorting domain-containing protein [Tabrizicola sp. TH137]|uniref:VPLPA-CTERM sorting domain-containing protein n=1 Tax=Tabrizicola sp. TH137 TaxID=2067452 RepID=UPI001180BC07|nr:VPLPA-CTERM sorting domain-containing protein [Tabrizicola sp. TH137]